MNSFAAVGLLVSSFMSAPSTLVSGADGYGLPAPSRFSTADMAMTSPSASSVSSLDDGDQGGAVGNGGDDEEKASLGAVAGQTSGLSGGFDPGGGASGMMAFDAGGGASGMVAFEGPAPTGLGSLDDALGLGRRGSQGAAPMVGHIDAGGGAVALGR